MTLREDSGSVDSDDPLLSTFYSLLRDFVHPGDLEKTVVDIERAVNKGDKVTQYTNGWLAKYAENLAVRIRKLMPAIPLHELWSVLTDEQRLELIQSACVGCGTLAKPCYCMRDE